MQETTGSANLETSTISGKELLTQSMTVAQLKDLFNVTPESDGRKHLSFNYPTVSLASAIEPQLVDKALGIYEGLKIHQTHVEMVDAEIEDRDASTAAHAARNAYGALMIYSIREYKRAHPNKETITLEDLDAFVLTPQQVREGALYVLANIAHDFGKGQVEAIDDNNNVLFYNQHMLTEKDNSNLTQEDFRRMKLHTNQGAYMIQNMFENLGIPTNSLFADTLISIAQHHHDKSIENNGTFVAEATLIATVIDQYDAMTSKRNYSATRKFSPREAKNDEKVQGMLTQFNNDELTDAYYTYIDLCIKEDEHSVHAGAGLQPAS